MSLQLHVTAVIPCRDDADFLQPCLAALDAQTRRPDRVVVVDNASSDGSAATAHAHGADVVREPLIGVWPAAARGYDEAMSGTDVIARLDADSRPHPDWVSRIVRAFAADPHLGVLTGGAEFYDGGRLANYFGSHWYVGGGHYWIERFVGIPLVFGSNFAMRTAVWRRVREVVDRTNPGIHDDLDLTIRLRPSDGVRYDPTLRMPVSARPFATPWSLGQRLWKVIPTFAASWPEGAGWRRTPGPVAPDERADWDDGLAHGYGR